MKKVFLLLVAVVYAVSVYAQNSKEKIEFKLTMRDGNIMSGVSGITSVSLVTDYGKLEIPVKNVTSIEFGIAPDAANKSKIENLLKQLSNSAEDQRKAAYDELEKLDIRAIPVISDFMLSGDYTPSDNTDYTPEILLSEMKAKYNVEEDYSDKDVVTIDYDYKMGGSYALKSINLKTEFGTLDIPKERIKNVEVTYENMDESLKAFKLMASKHISSNQNGGWLNTGISVKSGQKLTITATGEVSLASLSGNKYHPDGSTGTTPATNYEDDYSTTTSTYPSYGNVVYKIGENGTMMKAGANFNGTVKQSGVVYISIYETVYNASNTGFYTVKVKGN
jgi:hypothetical protein